MALRFQQVTGPVMAKAVEDTAFYRYMPLLALNEVGGDPGTPGTDANEFHSWCAGTHARHPFGLLATSTHDTKRSEDVRARMSVLSEYPTNGRKRPSAGTCSTAGTGWRTCRTRHRVDVVPDAGGGVADIPGTSARVPGKIRKGGETTHQLGPAKPNLRGRSERLRSRVMRSRRFVSELAEFVDKVRAPGRSNSLALKLLTLTGPGVPDLYQGSELWDLSVVDPDNRRPVDYEAREALLDEAASADLASVWRPGDERGLTKLAVVRRTLRLRARGRARSATGEAALISRCSPRAGVGASCRVQPRYQCGDRRDEMAVATGARGRVGPDFTGPACGRLAGRPRRPALARDRPGWGTASRVTRRPPRTGTGHLSRRCAVQNPTTEPPLALGKALQ